MSPRAEDGCRFPGSGPSHRAAVSHGFLFADTNGQAFLGSCKYICTLAGMRSVMVTWVGKIDLRAPEEVETVGLGPIARALDARSFDEVLLVSDHSEKATKPFVRWLQARSGARIRVAHELLSSPMAFGEIYEAAARCCSNVLADQPRKTHLVFHLSPGTPAMAAVWILLAKTRFPAELLESSTEHGVRTAEVPFDIAVDFLPDLLRERDERLRALSGAHQGSRQP